MVGLLVAVDVVFMIFVTAFPDARLTLESMELPSNVSFTQLEPQRYCIHCVQWKPIGLSPPPPPIHLYQIPLVATHVPIHISHINTPTIHFTLPPLPPILLLIFCHPNLLICPPFLICYFSPIPKLYAYLLFCSPIHICYFAPPFVNLLFYLPHL